MARAVQSTSTFIDLTGDDEDDDSIARAHAACQKVFAAASRLSNHFESLKPPKPVAYQRLSETFDLTKKNSPSPTIPQPVTLPRPGTSPKPARSETDGPEKGEKRNAIPRRNFSVPNPSASLPQSTLRIAASRSARSPPILERTEGNKKRPRETASITPSTDAFTIRTPRSAAISAKQNIAEACSELEDWVNKDPKVISRQAGVSTPRRPGKPNDDLDEWSPGTHTKYKEEEEKEVGRTFSDSPAPSAEKQESLIAKGENILYSTSGVSTSLGIKKRRFSGSLQSRGSSVKMARWGEKPNPHYEPTPPSSPEPPNRRHMHDEAGNLSPAGLFQTCVYPAIKAAKAEYKQSLTEHELTGIGESITNDIVEQGVEAFCLASANFPKDERTGMISRFVTKIFRERALNVKNGFPIEPAASAEYLPKGVTAPKFESDLKASELECNSLSKDTVMMNNESSAEPSNVELEKNGASAKAPMLYTQEKNDPRPQPGFHEAPDPTSPELGLYPASPGRDRYSALFDSVVYPAIKKSKKRYKDSLPGEDLDAIGKIISDEVFKKLMSQSETAHKLDEETEKKIKNFIKKLFRQKVRKANMQCSLNSATLANDSRLGIALPSSGPGSTTGGTRPPAPVPDHFETVWSSRTTAVDEKEEATRQPDPKPLDQPPSSSLQQSPNDSPMAAFGPNFDRGRYPALRRRRGNKYYTPPKVSKTISNKSHSIPNGHNNNSGGLNGRDQVRLSKALSNQPETVRARATQLTALTSAAVKSSSPTNQDSALKLLASIDESTNIEHVVTEPASYADASKTLREVSGHDQARMTDFGETPPNCRGPGFLHVAKSQTNTAINQSIQQTHRNRLLENSNRSNEIRPWHRQPATALDPSLEHVVAVSVTDTSNGPSHDGQSYSVTPKNRMQLVNDHSIVKLVDPSSKPGKPKLIRIETKVIDPVRRSGNCISSLLRNRELGLTSRGRHVGTIAELHQLKSETIEPWKNWKGASGDVVAVAWNQDSNVYAFGAAAHTNIEDIQYNRPCNLLLGNLTSNQIRELPDHRIDRPKPQTIPNGPNSTQAVYDACDPKVYKTVTSIAFAPTGDRMFTASHDCTVKIWDVLAEDYQCLSTLQHEAWVTSIEISEHRQGLFATASKSVKDAIRIYHDPSDYVPFSASRAKTRPEWKIYPECLRWGPNPYTSHLLLAGFQQWEQQGDLLSGGGQLCLWDAYTGESIKVTPSSQNVHAAAWHSTQPFFATGGAPGNNVSDKANTNTVVRIWDWRTPKRCQIEYECPATDMQDITFCPSNPNIVTAGCTDGSSYVWDWRWPDQPLHRLKHGRPLWGLDHTKEEADTGVMLSVWGPGGTLFYTGSSDGVIKTWDVRRHPKDVLVDNVANLGVEIISGAFSPDGNNLLVGDADGGIHILSSAPSGPRSDVKSTDESIDFVRASDGSGLKLNQNDDNPGAEGIEAARSLVESGQLEYHKELGVGQGPNYQGPYAAYARKEAAESAVGRLRKKFEKKQPISKRGKKRWDIAIPMTTLLDERKETLDLERDGDKIALDNLDEREPETTQRSEGEEALATSPFFSTHGALAAAHPLATKSVGASIAGGAEDQSDEDDTISESEMIEENYWWVGMGEEEIDQARRGRLKG